MRGRTLWILAAVAATTALASMGRAQTLSQRLRTEPLEELAQAARAEGDAVRGAILFTRQELLCTRCHAPADDKALGPDLRRLGKDVTDQYLVEALLVPSKAIRKGFESAVVIDRSGKTYSGRIIAETPQQVTIRLATDNLELKTLARSEIETIRPSPISAMPDNLADQLANRQQFLDLAKYVLELAAAAEAGQQVVDAGGGGSPPAELQGIVLIQEHQCGACHTNDLAPQPVAPRQPPRLAWIAGRVQPRYLERFLADPAEVKPEAAMFHAAPGLDASQRAAAAKEITHYLLAGRMRQFAFQDLDPEAAQRGRELFHTVGCVACHSPRDDAGRELSPAESVPLRSLPEKLTLPGLVDFLKNPHDARPSGRMPNMQLTHWEAVDLANYLLSGSTVPHEEPYRIDPLLSAKGEARFAELGCVQCHAVDEPPRRPFATPLSRVRPGHGCLSGEAGDWPRFDLPSEQRRAIEAGIARGSREYSDEERITLTLAAFRCLNCHQRGDLGGVSAERNAYFHTTNPNLGPQGRIPPTLTGVGAKLNPGWMRQVLVSGRAIRPYVKTRMPQYGAEHVAHLVELFARVDSLPDAPPPKAADAKEMRDAGAQLAGTDGLNCIACHTFQLKQAANMPAVDLTEMAERLQRSWFDQYMRNPQRLSLNTIMPSFWPGGRAMRQDILDGDADLQIEALWQYLLEGRQARQPKGLIVEPLELLAGDEAVMLRRSYPDVGKRGVGVGYPLQLNLVFDAEQMRLASLWKGKFADPGGVWRSQGHGVVRPLGHSRVSFPKGPELDDPDSPWIVDDGRPPRHRFGGYALDDHQRPRFLYRFGDVEVSDYPVDVLDPSTGQPILRRTLTMQAESGERRAVFRAAEAERIEQEGDGRFLIGDSLRIRVDAAHRASIVASAAGKQLHIPLVVTSSPTTLILEYAW